MISAFVVSNDVFARRRFYLYTDALLQCPLPLPGPPSHLLGKGGGAQQDLLLFLYRTVSVRQYCHFIVVHVSLVVVRQQPYFFDVHSHHIMLVRSYASHVCSLSLFGKQSLKILSVPHFSCDGLAYAFCGFLFRTVTFQHRIHFRSKTD